MTCPSLPPLLPLLPRPSRRASVVVLSCVALAILFVAAPSYAIDLVDFAGIEGPLVAALTQMAALAPGIKALVGFIGFCVALIALAALRNFAPVLFYLGLAIFGAVGLVVSGAIMGTVV